jgi:hypothetical protein
LHLIQNYACQCGVQIDRPYIYPKFFPIAVDKYICCHFQSKQAKTYDFAQEVIDLLLPILKKENIHIIQLGKQDERLLAGCYSTVGQCVINQVAYVIKNSMLVCGVDSFPIHFASYYDKKIVALYSNSYAANVKPYWGNPENHILIESDRFGNKPSFAMEENPKTMNRIAPEKVAAAVCKLLGLKFDYPYESILINNGYQFKIVESVPDTIIDTKRMGIDSLFLRMDIKFDEMNLQKQLQVGKCTIITNKPIHELILKNYRPNISEIVYIIDDNHKPDFIKLLREFKIGYKLLTYLSDEKIKPLKLQYLDYGIIFKKDINPPSEIDMNKLENYYYKSNKFLLSNQKVFPSFYDFLNNRPINTLQSELKPIISNNIEKLWEEKDFFYFLKGI